MEGGGPGDFRGIVRACACWVVEEVFLSVDEGMDGYADACGGGCSIEEGRGRSLGRYT